MRSLPFFSEYQLPATVEEEAIRLASRQLHAYNGLADVYRSTGDLDRAGEIYWGLLEANPGEPGTANNLANLYLEQGRITEALDLARQAHLGAPKNPHVLDTLGWALELSGRSEEAGPFLKGAVAALDESPEVLLHWGINLRSREQLEIAEDVLGDVVDLAPRSRFAAQAAELLRKGPE